MVLSQQQNSKNQDEQLVALPVLQVLEEADEVRTFRLDNSEGRFPLHQPGMFVKVCLDINGENVWRSFSISSSPLQPEKIDLTIKRNPQGIVGNYFFEQIHPGSIVHLKGPLGQFYFDQELHQEPLVFLCAGIGITPMMSIVRCLNDLKQNRPCYLFYGTRTHRNIIFDEETRQLMTQMPGFHYFLTLSQPAPHWLGYCGHLNFEFISPKIPQLTTSRFFLCGPNGFNQDLEERLLEAGVPQTLIHREQFHKKRKTQ